MVMDEGQSGCRHGRVGSGQQGRDATRMWGKGGYRCGQAQPVIRLVAGWVVARGWEAVGRWAHGRRRAGGHGWEAEGDGRGVGGRGRGGGRGGGGGGGGGGAVRV